MCTDPHAQYYEFYIRTAIDVMTANADRSITAAATVIWVIPRALPPARWLLR